jgi:hypothetical protein
VVDKGGALGGQSGDDEAAAAAAAADKEMTTDDKGAAIEGEGATPEFKDAADDARKDGRGAHTKKVIEVRRRM